VTGIGSLLLNERIAEECDALGTEKLSPGCIFVYVLDDATPAANEEDPLTSSLPKSLIFFSISRVVFVGSKMEGSFVEKPLTALVHTIPSSFDVQGL
jgi:hypothetical protein